MPDGQPQPVPSAPEPTDIRTPSWWTTFATKVPTEKLLIVGALVLLGTYVVDQREDRKNEREDRKVTAADQLRISQEERERDRQDRAERESKQQRSDDGRDERMRTWMRAERASMETQNRDSADVSKRLIVEITELRVAVTELRKQLVRPGGGESLRPPNSQPPGPGG